jgi:hypothetical protein
MKRLLQKISLLLAVLLLTTALASRLHAQVLINKVAGEFLVTQYDGDGGPAALAHFSNAAINGVFTADKKGNAYILDGQDANMPGYVIRKIDARGFINRYAGTGVTNTSGTFEGEGGLVINAALNNITCMAADSVGNLYMQEYGGNATHAIRKIDAQTGIITTITSTAGTISFGPGVLAKDAVFGVQTTHAFTVDVSGNLYVIVEAASQQKIFKIDHATGMISVHADLTGTILAPDGTYTKSTDPDDPALVKLGFIDSDMAIDGEGNIYLADQATGQCIYKITPSGVMTRVAGVRGGGFDASGDGGPATDATLWGPIAIAVDNANNLFIADQGNYRIRRVDAITGIITTYAGNGLDDFAATGDGGLAVDAGLGYVASVRIGKDNDLFSLGFDDIRKVAERLVTFTFDTIPALTYGDAAFTLNAYASNASVPTFRSGNPAAVMVTADGHATIVGADTVTLFADFPAIGTDTAVTRKQTITVAKKELTVTANNQTITIDDLIPALTFRYEGFVNGEDSMILATLPVAITTATDASPEGNYPITVDGGIANNYSFTYVPGTLHIAARVLKPQTITFNAITDKTYGDADFATGVVSNNITIPVTFQSSDTKVATVSSAGTVHIIGAGPVTITASQAADAFYTAAADVAQTFTVNKALLSITADNKTKAYGADLPSLTLTYSGWKNGDTTRALTTVPQPVTTATKTADAGTYPINISDAAAANYTFEYHSGVLTITALTQTINFPALPVKSYADGDFLGGATSTNTTVPVTYSSSNTAVATINADGTIHITGVGTTTITASQAANTNYTAAQAATRQLTVVAASLLITADDQTMTQGQELPAFTFSYSGFKQGETVTILTAQPVATTAVTKNTYPGIYPIRVSGAAANDHYVISYQSGNLNVLVDSTKSGDQLNSWMSSSSQLQVNVFTTTNQKATIEIFSLYGQRVASQQVYLVYANNTFQVPVANIASGLYVVRVTGQYLRLTQRIRIGH